MSTQPDGYTCECCGNILKRESNFLKHRCKEMIRAEELKSVKGQAAYELYSYWLSNKKKGKHTLNTFGQSKFFSTFYKFVTWSNKVNVPDKKLYIRFMNLKDYPPTMWTDNLVYAQFLEWIDMKWTAADHFKHTYVTLQKISKVAECDISEAFGMLNPNHVLVYVRARKLSPWVLLKMQSFKEMFITLTKEQQLLF